MIKAKRSPAGVSPVEGGLSEAERADVEGSRAADAIKKNSIKQRPADETSDAAYGPRGPDRPSGPPSTGGTPAGRH